MLGICWGRRILVYQGTADMRKSFDGLEGLVRTALGADPLTGDVYVFRNRRGDLLKLLYWDGDGYVLWYKRLEAGTFRLPEGSEVSAALLSAMLAGIEYKGIRQGKRYGRTGTGHSSGGSSQQGSVACMGTTG